MDKLIIVQIDGDIVMNIGNNSIDWEKTNALPSLLKNHIKWIPVYVDLKWAVRDIDLDLNNIRF